MGNSAYMQRIGEILDWLRVRQRIFLLALGTVLILYSARLVLWDTTVYRAKILFDSGKPAEAARAFARARQFAPPGTEAEAWFSRELISSNLSVDKQELNLVLYNSLKASIENEEEFEDSYVLLAAAMIRDGRSTEAREVLKRAVCESPNWPLLWDILRTIEPKRSE
jgi:tetratricopeptide (TPR) repeat protein